MQRSLMGHSPSYTAIISLIVKCLTNFCFSLKTDLATFSLHVCEHIVLVERDWLMKTQKDDGDWWNPARIAFLDIPFLRSCSPTNRARLLTALVYKLRDLLHKIHFLTALKTLDTTYKQRLVGEQIR